MDLLLCDCVFKARSLNSHIGDWSDWSSLNDEKTKRGVWLKCCDEFSNTVWGATTLNLLGHALSDVYGDSLAVLDIGSGESKTFKNMTTGIINRKMTYHSIDLLPTSTLGTDELRFPRSNTVNETDKHAADPCISEWIVNLIKPFGKSVIERPLCHTHHKCDVHQVVHPIPSLPMNHFHVMIVDVEPHGHETTIIESFEQYMQDDYMIVFKCIGFIDLFGTAMADRALKSLRDAHKLIDVFAVANGLRLTRDVFAVCTRRAGGVPFSGTLYNQLLEGGILPTYRDNTLVQMCVYPSKVTMNRLIPQNYDY